MGCQEGTLRHEPSFPSCSTGTLLPASCLLQQILLLSVSAGLAIARNTAPPPCAVIIDLDSTTPWVLAHQAPLSMGFSRHKYWSGLPCPPPGDLPDPGIEPVSPVSHALQADSLPLSHWGGPCLCRGHCKDELEGSAMVTGVPIRISCGGSC